MRYYRSPTTSGEGNTPEDLNAIKAKMGVKDITEVKCECCKKRTATTVAVRPFETNPIPVCNVCYDNILDEESE